VRERGREGGRIDVCVLTSAMGVVCPRSEEDREGGREGGREGEFFCMWSIYMYAFRQKGRREGGREGRREGGREENNKEQVKLKSRREEAGREKARCLLVLTRMSNINMRHCLPPLRSRREVLTCSSNINMEHYLLLPLRSRREVPTCSSGYTNLSVYCSFLPLPIPSLSQKLTSRLV